MAVRTIETQRETASGSVRREQSVFASGNESFLKTADGETEVLAAAEHERRVIIVVTVDTAFAAGDGAAPVFDIGETGDLEKFKADLNTGSAGDTITYAGVLSANTALIVDATAATGTTSTGAITVVALAIP